MKTCRTKRFCFCAFDVPRDFLTSLDNHLNGLMRFSVNSTFSSYYSLCNSTYSLIFSSELELFARFFDLMFSQGGLFGLDVFHGSVRDADERKIEFEN